MMDLNSSSALGELWGPQTQGPPLYDGVMPAWSLSRYVVRIQNKNAYENALKIVDFYADRVANCYGLNSVFPFPPSSILPLHKFPC